MHSASITNKVVKSVLCIREFWGGDLHVRSQTLSVCFVLGIQACLPLPQRPTKESYLFARGKSAASQWNQAITK